MSDHAFLFFFGGMRFFRNKSKQENSTVSCFPVMLLGPVIIKKYGYLAEWQVMLWPVLAILF